MASLLVDEGIGRDLLQALVAQSYQAIHWLDSGHKGAHDALVFLAAQQRSLTIFTHNLLPIITMTMCSCVRLGYMGPPRSPGRHCAV